MTIFERTLSGERRGEAAAGGGQLRVRKSSRTSLVESATYAPRLSLSVEEQ